MLGCNWRTGHCDPQGARDKAEGSSRQGTSKSILKVQSCGRSMTRVHPSPCFPPLPYPSPQHTTHLVPFPLSVKALASSARFLSLSRSQAHLPLHLSSEACGSHSATLVNSHSAS